MATLPPVTRPFRFDLPALERLLREAGLANTGLPEALDDYLVAREGERLVGAVGVAYHAPVAVLHALAVTPPARGRGIGRALMDAMRADAARVGARYLLVPAGASDRYFERLGYAPLAGDALAAAQAAGLPASETAYLARAVE